MDFKVFKSAISKRFEELSNSQELFIVDLNKDGLWETYLDSFPPGTNEIYKERREYDCQTCKQFIRSAGGVVAISVIDNTLFSIWDVEVPEPYQTVANMMSSLVKAAPIKNIFRHYQQDIGKDYNIQRINETDEIKWNHFHFKLPKRFVSSEDEIGSVLSHTRSTFDVFRRSMEEITLEAAETILELIKQKSIYRGEEYRNFLEMFITQKETYLNLEDHEKENWCWTNSIRTSNISVRIRNTAIGTLLVNLSQGMDLNVAVGKYESIVAPQNYKRPKALVTKSMIRKAQEKVEALGISDSLQRRYAVESDLTVNNVIFADRSTTISTVDVFNELLKETVDNVKNLDKVKNVTIEDFIQEIVPEAESIEIMFFNKYENNLMSLIAPNVDSAPNILKWDNNFSWTYNNNVTDSMKDRVRKAGGKVDGVLRFSIQWNDGDNNQNDFDAHCIEPNGNHIYFGNKQYMHPSTGILDVDIINPGEKVAVENITWSDINHMEKGIYIFYVYNYQHNGGKTGFTAEIEYNGKIYSYEYNKELIQYERVLVASIDFDKSSNLKFIRSLPSTTATKEIWNINTNKFHRVKMLLNSPNYWDDNNTGNKHWFFILQDCLNPDNARGLFNEYLNNDLHDHRKVFEVLGSKLLTEKSTNQLSGLGFSSTKRNEVLCRIKGNFKRIINITF